MTDDAMEHIAELLDLTPAEVLGTASFYTMFKREPVGTYLRVGLHEHRLSHRRRLRAARARGSSRSACSPDGTTADGVFTLEEVECLAHCDKAPCLQVNYRFFGPVTPDDFDRAVRRPARRTPRARRPRARRDQPRDAPAPDEHGERRCIAWRFRGAPDILFSRMGFDDSHTVDRYVAHRRLRGPAGGAEAHAGGAGRGGQALGAARPRRRRLLGRDEVELPAAPTAFPATWSSTATRASPRRSRTISSSSAIPTSSSRAPPSPPTRSSAGMAFLYIRGEFALGHERLAQSRSQRRTRAATSGATSSGRATTSTSCCTPAPARTSAARRPRCSTASKGYRGRAAHPPAVPRDQGPVPEAHRRQQRRDAVQPAVDRAARRRRVRRAREGQVHRHPHLVAVAAT